MAAFQWLVRELCEDSSYRQKDLYLRWQANALFTFQTATVIHGWILRRCQLVCRASKSENNQQKGYGPGH